jgi:hypothetical protein
MVELVKAMRELAEQHRDRLRARQSLVTLGG